MGKRLILILLLTIGCIGAAQAADGWTRSIHVEWGYTPPEDISVQGFRLYQDSAKVCEWAGATITSGDCSVSLTRRSTDFTLTAAFGDGTESPKSAPFTLPDVGPAPQIIILIGK
jgi:hypothetical protein